MRQTYKFPVIYGIFTETSHIDSHTIFKVNIQFYLRTIIFFHVTDKLLRSTWKFCFLWEAFEINQFFNQLLFGWFLAELHKYSCCMTIQYRYTDTLTGDHRFLGLYNHTIFNLTPDSQRFLLALLLFTTDIWNNIFNHFRPVFKCFSGTGDCLICSSNYFIWLKFFPCGQNRCITLDRTVRFNCNKSTGCTQTFFLEFNHIEMLRVNLRNNHRNIRGPSVSTVVRNNRCLCFRILFFDSLDLVF